jgi:hypothetical protein
MMPLSRRSMLHNLGLVTAGSLAGGSLFSDPPDLLGLTCPFVPSVAKDSVCVFLDGSWLLRATDSNLMAVTVCDCKNLYRQTKWPANDKPVFTDLDHGVYEVKAFGNAGSCTCPFKVLGSQSHYLPYIHGVQCIFEPTPSGPGAAIDQTLRIITLPTPDKLHTAARISFGKGDYRGGECSTSNFKAPSQSPTVVILEYKNAQSLTVTSKTSGLLIDTVEKGKHYHFRVSLKDTTMSGYDEEQHIVTFTKSLACKLRHQSDGSPVDFYFDPAEMSTCKKLHVEEGVRGISPLELGITDTIPGQCGKGNGGGAGPVFTLGKPGQGNEQARVINLANCAAGIVGGGR